MSYIDTGTFTFQTADGLYEPDVWEELKGFVNTRRQQCGLGVFSFLNFGSGDAIDEVYRLMIELNTALQEAINTTYIVGNCKSYIWSPVSSNCDDPYDPFIPNPVKETRFWLGYISTFRNILNSMRFLVSCTPLIKTLDEQIVSFGTQTSYYTDDYSAYNNDWAGWPKSKSVAISDVSQTVFGVVDTQWTGFTNRKSNIRIELIGDVWDYETEEEQKVDYALDITNFIYGINMPGKIQFHLVYKVGGLIVLDEHADPYYNEQRNYPYSTTIRLEPNNMVVDVEVSVTESILDNSWQYWWDKHVIANTEINVNRLDSKTFTQICDIKG